MFCYKCGKPQNDDVNFCGYCGANLKNKKEDLMENYISQEFDSDINIVNDKKDLSILGNLSLVFGLFVFLLFIIFTGFKISTDLHNKLVFILPVFSLFSLILSIINMYKDNNFNRVMFSFYISFSTFVFIAIYWGYIYLINFLI